MRAAWIRSTYWQLLWQPAEWTLSCIDVWVEPLRQQAGGPDGLWWPSCRLNTPTGETRALISSLLPHANNLGPYRWQREGRGGHFVLAVLGGSQDTNGNSALIHWLNQSGANMRASSRVKARDVWFHDTDDMVSSAKVTTREDRRGSSWSTTQLPKQAWLLMSLLVHKVPELHLYV